MGEGHRGHAEHGVTRAYQEHPSTEPRVDTVWVQPARCFESPSDAIQIVPADGAIDVILERWGNGPARLFIFPSVPSFTRVELRRGESMVGVRFKPGCAGPLLSDRASRRAIEALDPEQLSAENIVDSLGESLDAIGHAPSLVETFVRLARECRGDARIAALSRLIGAHERTLQRLAARWIGLSPKALMRIFRARAAAKEIGAGLPLVDVAAMLGYADQAHMTRDLRAILGRAPSSYRPVGNLQDRQLPAR